MGFFDTVVDTVTNAGREVGDKAKELAETTKIKNEIAAEKRKIKEEYEKIGRLYVKEFKDRPNPLFVESVNKIAASEKLIADKEAELDDAKVFKVCPNCGAGMSAESKFCSKCGQEV